MVEQIAQTSTTLTGLNVTSLGSDLNKEPEYVRSFDKAKHLRDFRKYNPPTFNGSLKNPTKAELWLSSVETIFQYIKCLED